MSRKIAFVLITVALLFTWVHAATYVLSASPDGNAPIYVNDDLKITLNKKDGHSRVLLDDESHSPSTLPPVVFEASKGDEIEIEATDTTEPAELKKSHLPDPHGHKELSPIYLVNRDTGESVCIFAGLPEMNSSWKGTDTFVSLTYTIGTPTRIYCLSSSSTGCVKVEVSDDLPLIKITSSGYTAEIHPDTDGKPRSNFLINVVLPVYEDENPEFELELSNVYKDSYSTPLYLVPHDGGQPVTILGYTIFVDGDCEDYTTCPEVVFYSFDDVVETSTDYVASNSGFSVKFSDLDSDDYYGFYADLRVLESPVFLYVFFTDTDGRNVFLTDRGFSYQGFPIQLVSDVRGPVEIPAKQNWLENMFIAGTYAVGVADLDGDYVKSYNFTIDTLEKDIENVSLDFDYEQGYDVVPSEEEVDADRIFLFKNLEGETAGSSSFTFEYEEGNSTVSCTVYPVESAAIKSGFIARPVTTTDFTGMFVMGAYCVTDNDTFVEPNAVMDRYLMGVNIKEKNSERLIFMKNALKKGNKIFIYTKYPLMNVTDAQLIGYSFEVLTKRGASTVWTSPVYAASISPVNYYAESPEGYDSGALLNVEVTEGGSVYYSLEFGLDVKDREDQPPPSGFVNVWLFVDLDNDGKMDMKVKMEEVAPGQFRSTVPLVSGTAGESNTISYSFYAQTKDGKPVTGLLLQKTFDLSFASSNYPVALKIGGNRHLVLGSRTSFTFSAQSGQMLHDENVDVYLGLYKKGRGTVWFIDRIPGAGVPGTSAVKKPLVANVKLSLFRKAVSATFPVEIPSPYSLEGAFYPGEYAWILEMDNHDTGERIAYAVFPFEVEAW